MPRVPKPKPRPKVKAPLKRGTRPKARNDPRRKERHLHAYGSAERIVWMHAQVCAAGTHHCAGPIEIVHVKNGGMGLKAAAHFTIPLCQHHHRMAHHHGRRVIEEMIGNPVLTVAGWYEDAWHSHAPSVHVQNAQSHA